MGEKKGSVTFVKSIRLSKAHDYPEPVRAHERLSAN